MDKREEFLRVADEIAKDREPDPWTAEPWPDWFRKVVLRLVRVFIPDLKRADFEFNRERFEGQGLAFVSGLIEEAQKVDTTKFPDAPHFQALKIKLESMGTSEADRVQAALHAASVLPSQEAAEFFEAYAEGLKKKTANFALERFGDSQTAQICLFLMWARPWIEKRRVANVTELFKNFMQIKEVFPGQKEFFVGNAKARASWEQHFRRICSEDGVKLAPRGHPKANKGANKTSKAKAR
jgi:hypothetical protein